MTEERRYRIVPERNYYNQIWIILLGLMLFGVILSMVLTGRNWGIAGIILIFLCFLVFIDVKSVKMSKHFKKIWNKYKTVTYKEKIK